MKLAKESLIREEKEVRTNEEQDCLVGGELSDSDSASIGSLWPSDNHDPATDNYHDPTTTDNTATNDNHATNDTAIRWHHLGSAA
jgi:hypothetical protein